jgi:hypothetical protein
MSTNDSLHCTMTSFAIFPLLAAKDPRPWLLDKKTAGTKGELTGTGQRHIKTHGRGVSHLSLS